MWGGIILVVVFVWWWMGLAPFNQKVVSPKTTGTAKTTTTAGASIEIKGSRFNPASLTVKARENVSVKNSDIMGHSLTADGASFDTGVISQGKSATFMAPDKSGTYKFHCKVHPSMTGTLIVE